MPLGRGRFHPAPSNRAGLPPPIAKGDRATSIPGAAQFGKRGFACEQAPDTRGVAEDFIERERDKVVVPAGEV
jgi:hypothetical protein